jgi:hypothetical protein
MDRRKIFVLVALLFVAVPLVATDCTGVFLNVPFCDSGCITPAQMAALLSISLSDANMCLKGYKDAGQIVECTTGGERGYCRYHVE